MSDFYLTLKPGKQSIGHIWKTSVQVSLDGTEKRSALLQWPRIVLNYSYILHNNAEKIWLKRKLYSEINEIFRIPIWPDWTKLIAKAASGQAILAVESTNFKRFFEDRDCILIDPDNLFSYEKGTISSFSDTQITLSSNLSNTWESGAFVLPIYGFRLQNTYEIGHEIGGFSGININAVEAFEEIPDFTYSAPSSGANQYESIDIFEKKPIKKITQKFEKPFDYIQFLGIGTGYSLYDNLSIPYEADQYFSFEFLETSDEQIREIFDFFDSKTGKLGSFWLPTWSRDLVVTEAFSSSDTDLIVENIENIEGRYLWIKFPDGTTVQKEVESTTSTTITLTEIIGKTVTESELDDLFLCFLGIGRFDTDQLIAEYVRDGAARFKIPFKAFRVAV